MNSIIRISEYNRYKSIFLENEYENFYQLCHKLSITNTTALELVL